MPFLNISHEELVPGIEVLANDRLFYVFKQNGETVLHSRIGVEAVDPTANYSPAGTIYPGEVIDNKVHAVFLKDHDMGYYKADVSAPSSLDGTTRCACVLPRRYDFLVAEISPFFPSLSAIDSIIEKTRMFSVNERIEIANVLFLKSNSYTPHKVYSETEFALTKTRRHNEFVDLLAQSIREAIGRVPFITKFQVHFPNNIKEEGFDYVGEAIKTWFFSLMESICRGRRDDPSEIASRMERVSPELIRQYRMPEHALLVPINLVRYEKLILSK